MSRFVAGCFALLAAVGLTVRTAAAAGLTDLIAAADISAVSTWVDGVMAVLVSIGLVFFGYKLFRRMTGR